MVIIDDKKLKEIKMRWKTTHETMKLCNEGRSIHDARALSDACYDVPLLIEEIEKLKKFVDDRPYHERDCSVCWNEKRMKSTVRPVCENCISQTEQVAKPSEAEKRILKLYELLRSPSLKYGSKKQKSLLAELRQLQEEEADRIETEFRKSLLMSPTAGQEILDEFEK